MLFRSILRGGESQLGTKCEGERERTRNDLEELAAFATDDSSAVDLTNEVDGIGVEVPARASLSATVPLARNDYQLT